LAQSKNVTKIADKIFELIFKGKKVTRDDIDYTLIYERLKELPPEELIGFYEEFATGTSYRNEKGFVSVPDFYRAVRDYKEFMVSRFWRDNGLQEKLETLLLKIESISHLTSKIYAEQLSQMCSDPTKFKNKETNSSLFNADELGVIGNSLEDYINTHKQDGSVVLKEKIEDSYKSFITKKYLTEDTYKAPEIESKPISLLSNSVKKF